MNINDEIKPHLEWITLSFGTSEEGPFRKGMEIALVKKWPWFEGGCLPVGTTGQVVHVDGRGDLWVWLPGHALVRSLGEYRLACLPQRNVEIVETNSKG